MKRFISLLLVLVMVFPMQGYASEPVEAEGISSYSMDYDKDIHSNFALE